MRITNVIICFFISLTFVFGQGKKQAVQVHVFGQKGMLLQDPAGEMNGSRYSVGVAVSYTATSKIQLRLGIGVEGYEQLGLADISNRVLMLPDRLSTGTSTFTVEALHYLNAQISLGYQLSSKSEVFGGLKINTPVGENAFETLNSTYTRFDWSATETERTYSTGRGGGGSSSSGGTRPDYVTGLNLGLSVGYRHQIHRALQLEASILRETNPLLTGNKFLNARTAPLSVNLGLSVRLF